MLRCMNMGPTITWISLPFRDRINDVSGRDFHNGDWYRTYPNGDGTFRLVLKLGDTTIRPKFPFPSRLVCGWYVNAMYNRRYSRCIN
jgi:hypothetical protein